jgi:hypothetical protein
LWGPSAFYTTRRRSAGVETLATNPVAMMTLLLAHLAAQTLSAPAEVPPDTEGLYWGDMPEGIPAPPVAAQAVEDGSAVAPWSSDRARGRSGRNAT